MAVVKLSGQAEKALERLFRSDRHQFTRVESALQSLADNPGAGKLLKGPLATCRSLRVGALRILYRYDSAELLVLILGIAPRGKVYRDRE